MPFLWKKKELVFWGSKRNKYLLLILAIYSLGHVSLKNRLSREFFLESLSPSGHVMAFYDKSKDDKNKAYFRIYGSSSAKSKKIDVSYCIYDPQVISDKKMHCKTKITWSEDGQKAGLFIDKQPYVAINLEEAKSYDRTAISNLESVPVAIEECLAWFDQ